MISASVSSTPSTTKEGSHRKLAVRFKVNTATITKLLRLRRETGSYQPRPHGGGVAPTLDHDALERLRKLVEETPDATLETLRQKMGISGSRMIICRALQKLGLPLKKKTPHASERDTPKVQEHRREFAEDVEPIEPKRLVFVDETGVTTAMTPAYGRAPKGERVEASAPASWESVTVIAAMGLDGVRAPLALEGALNAATFLVYVEQVLVPALRRGDVVIFDNLSSHLSPAVSQAIGRAGASVLPLPPYSPDFNPIEKDRADCTSSDRWCEPLGAGYDRRRCAARAGRVVPTPPDRDTRRDPMPATARRIIPPRA
jgi:transposase